MRPILWLALSLALGVLPSPGPATGAASTPRQQTSNQAPPAISATSSKVWIARYASTKRFSAPSRSIG